MQSIYLAKGLNVAKDFRQPWFYWVTKMLELREIIALLSSHSKEIQSRTQYVESMLLETRQTPQAVPFLS